MKKYILFHGNCFDGAGAAYAAYDVFGPEAEFLPCFYGKPIPEVPKGAEVYMIDFSGSREEMQKLNKHTENRLTIIDHHKTAEESLKGLSYAKFNMDKSGALLAWEYFHPHQEVPELIKHISDRDLWNFKMEGTKEIHAALLSYPVLTVPLNFKLWDSLVARVNELKREGVALLRVSDQTVSMICEKAYPGEIDGHKAVIVNATSHWSEVGNKLLELHPEATVAASFYIDKDGKKWSLRSRKDFDCSVIAKAHGGGGHAQASGYVEKL